MSVLGEDRRLEELMVDDMIRRYVGPDQCLEAY